MSETCRLESFGQCCCLCKFRVATHDHCAVVAPEIREIGKCVCGTVNGFACTGIDGRIYTNWPEHSCGCENYTKKLELTSST